MINVINFHYICYMFNKSTKYAIQIVIFLLQKYETNNRYTAKEIAETLNIPSPFLSKISQGLVKKNIISSSKGKGGGFYLSKSNISMTLYDVILLFEQEDITTKCILGLPDCSDENPCVAHSFYIHFKKDLGTLLAKNLIDL